MHKAFKTLKHIWNVVGPIVLSACSLFITFHLVQPIALMLDPNFTLLASRSIGKIAFTTIAILHLVFFLLIRPQKFFKQFLKVSVYFCKERGWFSTLAIFFFIFFTLHWLVLLGMLSTGVIQYIPQWGTPKLSLIFSISWGILVTFFLAWSEELIFRGMLYQYFAEHWQPLTSLLAASLLFMLVHDLSDPLNLISEDWQLGLGLFLLGVMLNTIFVITGKLYTCMGAHMGLIGVKVVLRRMRFLSPIDLRQYLLVHLLFFLFILTLIFIYRKKLLPQLFQQTK